MSARPVVPRLDPEDLDLLISRSLDGDLAAEEEQKLQQILAADPEAARRRDELAGVVAALQALPNHEPPFAIATRVNVQVADRVKGLGSAWHRFGLYPPPGLVGAAIAVLVGLGLSSAFFTKPRPVSVASAPEFAKKSGSPVEVFFQSKEESKAESNEKDAPAAAPAPEPKTMIAESQLRRQTQADRLDAVSSEKRAEGRETGAGFAGKLDEDIAKKNAGRAGALGGKVSGSVASAPAEPAAVSADASAAPSSVAKDSSVKEEAHAADNKQLAKLKAAEAPRDEVTVNAAAGAVAQAPADQRVMAPSAPAAAPPARLRAQLPASKPRWSISIVGPAQIGASWRLKKTPTTAPPDRPVTVLYRLTLDRSGRVVSARTLVGAVPVEVDEMVRGLLFEPAGEAGENREVEVEITAK